MSASVSGCYAVKATGHEIATMFTGPGDYTEYETGTAISDEQLKKLKVNKTKRDDILTAFGAPSRIMTAGTDQLLCYDHQIIYPDESKQNVNETVTFIVNKKGVMTKVMRGKGQGANPLLEAAGKQ